MRLKYRQLNSSPPLQAKMNNDHHETCRCPYCAAEIATSATRCWCCWKVFPQGAKEYCAVERDGVVVKAANPTKFQYSLASLLLITLLVAVLSSIFARLPFLGGGLALLSLPALGRVIYLSMIHRSLGNPCTSGEKIFVFFKWIILGLFILVISSLIVAVTIIAVSWIIGDIRSLIPFIIACIVGVFSVGVLYFIFLRNVND
jgi:hypothetical protein